MTDSKYQKLILRAYDAYRVHQKLLTEAEDEYERRHGHHPSDIDDDWWIDIMHYGHGSPDLSEIEKNAKMSVGIIEGKGT